MCNILSVTQFLMLSVSLSPGAVKSSMTALVETKWWWAHDITDVIDTTCPISTNVKHLRKSFSWCLSLPFAAPVICGSFFPFTLFFLS